MSVESRIYLEKYIEDFGKQSTVYTAIVEAITNSIEAIERRDDKPNGKIDIYIERDNVLAGEATAKINKIVVEDNGVGFDDDNRDSFNTLFSQQKSNIGGKGLGRVFYIKYFKDVNIESVYLSDDKLKQRKFRFGRDYSIIENEEVSDVNIPETVGTRLSLSNYANDTSFSESIDLFSHRILEKILNYFVVEGYACPKITIHENDDEVVLNDLIGNDDTFSIKSENSGSFDIGDKKFNYKMFKLQNVHNQKSKIMLTANNKVVTDAKLEDYVPEFATDFIEKDSYGDDKKYIVRFYVYGDYLDAEVNNERSSFKFGDEPDMLYTIGRKTIEEHIAKIAKEIMSVDVTTRFTEKKKKVEEYADENIWYKEYVRKVDFENLKMNPTKSEIEATLHKVKFEEDSKRKTRVEELASNINVKDYDVKGEITKLIDQVNDTDRSNLAQYMSFRQVVLSLFKKALEWDSKGKYEKEEILHNIIFPTKHDSEDTPYNEHNLWIIDEKLNFTSYLSSDKNIFNESKGRPDLAAFHYAVSYRESDKASNPVSVFEFKRPGRNNFVDAGSKEADPLEQVIKYVKSIQSGDYKTPEGRPMEVDKELTPFYGYIIADIDKKIEEWLSDNSFVRMPDNQGWFLNHANLPLHIEFITWDKLLKDAEIRHRIFFEKLRVQR